MIATAQIVETSSSAGHGDIVVDVGRDFSSTPGGRYRRLGLHSGEEFREAVLAPKLREAVQRGVTLHVRIDIQRSYQPSFLDEAFAGLIRDAGFTATDLRDHLKIEAASPRFQKYKALAYSYIDSVS